MVLWHGRPSPLVLTRGTSGGAVEMRPFHYMLVDDAAASPDAAAERGGAAADSRPPKVTCCGAWAACGAEPRPCRPPRSGGRCCCWVCDKAPVFYKRRAASEDH